MLVSPDAQALKSSEGDWPIEGKDNVLAATSLLNYGGKLGVDREERSGKEVFSVRRPARIPPELIILPVADEQENSADLKRYV
jgi:hypothetical protein